MKTTVLSVDDLVGTYRTFGAEGPVYRVIGEPEGGNVRVRVVESGEELDYPLAQALNDPEAE